MQNENQQAVVKKDDASQRKSATVGTQPRWTIEDKSAIAAVIGNVFDLQKQFGKQVGQLENIIKGFCWALQPYSPQRVIEAFGIYVRSHSDMPTPFDIRQIIDPIQQPWKPDKPYYIKLQEIMKREGVYGLHPDEIEYIHAYDEFMHSERKNGA